jgi:streptogramin lyase
MRRRAHLAVVALLVAMAGAASVGPARAQSLYWIDTRFAAPTLNRSGLDGTGVTTLALPAGSLPEGLAADASGRVFWTEAAWSNAGVHHVAHDLAGNVTLVPGGSSLRGIAVDETAGFLYWTSSNLLTGPMIMRATLDGGGAAPLIALPLAANPRGIAVHHASGSLYWADFDNDRVYRANLDGTLPAIWQQLPPGAGPYGVAVNPSTGRVYWTEYGNGALRGADADGGNPGLVASGLSNPTYVAFHAASNRIFWTDGGADAQRIRRVNADGSGHVILPPPLTAYGGIGIGSGTSVDAPVPDLPTEFAIDRTWPNPTSGSLRVAFALPHDAIIRLAVLDVQGRQVALLADGLLPAGRHERVWASAASGRRPAPPGVYFARLTADGRSWVRRLVVTR